MRARFLRTVSLALSAFVLAVSPACPEETAAEKNARIRVETVQRQLKQREMAENMARQNQTRAWDSMWDALDKESWARSSRDKDFWRNETNKRKALYKDAGKELDAARKDTNKIGLNYLKAEEQYKNVAGHYYDPRNQERYTGRLGAVRVAAPEKPAGSGGGGEGGYDPQQAMTQIMTRTGNIQNAFKDGPQGVAAGIAETESGEIQNLMQGVLLDAKQQANRTMRPEPAADAANYGRTPDKEFQPFGSSTAGRLTTRGRAAARPDAPRKAQEPGIDTEKKILISTGRDDNPYATAAKTENAGVLMLREGENKFLAGDLKGALRRADEYIRLHPDDAKGYTLRAKILNKLRSFDGAADAAKRALELEPGGAQALRHLAWAQLHRKDYEAARAAADRLIELAPDNAQAYLMRAFAYEKLGMREKMLADLKRAAELDPKYRGHYEKALAGENLFDPDNARSDDILNELTREVATGPNPKVLIGLLLLLLAALAAGLPPLFQALAARWKKSRSVVRPRLAEDEVERTVLENAAPEPSPSAVSPVLTDGYLLAKKYKLLQVIGHGGMGKVWEALDTTLDRRVAVKQAVSDAGEQGSMVRQMYINEARTLASLRHPNIVDIFEILDRADGIYLVLEHVSGRTVQEELVKHRRISFARARAILVPVANALAFAHSKGVVHRDLKPSNIMITKQGYVKVMDFGIARAEGEAEIGLEAAMRGDLRVQHTRTLAGTPAYMPPEALKGKVSPATDTFALGACLYEFLTGDPPFEEEGYNERTAARFVPASSRVEGLSPRVDDLIARALEPDMTRRLPTPAAFAAALQAVA